MIRNRIYTDGRILPFGNGTICLKRIRNRDDKHIRIYRKHVEDGSYLLCMVSGIENNEPAYRAAVTGWFREYARVHLKEKADFYAKEMQVTFNRMVLEVFRDKFHDKFYSMTISFIYSAAKLSISCCLSAIAC